MLVEGVNDDFEVLDLKWQGRSNMLKMFTVFVCGSVCLAIFVNNLIIIDQIIIICAK